MKKIVLFLLIITSFIFKVDAQCTSNSLFTGLGIPGVFPPSIAIPGLPMLGINDGSLGSYYSQNLTLVILEDTILDVASFLPSNVVAAMNLAGISTIMSLNVNHASFVVLGLPNGISYECDQSNCQYPFGVDGCILLDGIPMQGGVFDVSIDMILSVNIPAVPNPIPGGAPIFAGMDIDLPSFSAQEYDLVINVTTSVNSNDFMFNIFPNPTLSVATIFVKELSELTIYNSFGKKVINYKDVIGNIFLNKEDIGSGIFYVNISSNNSKRMLKLIIN